MRRCLMLLTVPSSGRDVYQLRVVPVGISPLI
jgi:hypothetical protein